MKARKAPLRVEALWKIIKTEFKQCFVFYHISKYSVPTKKPEDCLAVVLYMTSVGALNIFWQ